MPKFSLNTHEKSKYGKYQITLWKFPDGITQDKINDRQNVMKKVNDIIWQMFTTVVRPI